MDQDSFPIIIGGVGGSGTRLFAETLHASGMRTVRDVNGATDAMGCALLYKRPSLLADLDSPGMFQRLWNITESGIVGGRPLGRQDRLLMKSLCREARPMHDRSWLKTRARKLRREASRPPRSGRWFLKEPNLHWIAPRILEIDPDIRFVMAVRHGIDMAFSTNQQQLVIWGPSVLNDPDLELSPVASLRYWCHVHRRIADFRDRHPDRVLILSFDQFCTEPETVARRLLEFSGIEATESILERVVTGVRAPSSIGRHLDEDLSQFDPGDMEFVDSFMSTIRVHR